MTAFSIFDFPDLPDADPPNDSDRGEWHCPRCGREFRLPKDKTPPRMCRECTRHVRHQQNEHKPSLPQKAEHPQTGLPQNESPERFEQPVFPTAARPAASTAMTRTWSGFSRKAKFATFSIVGVLGLVAIVFAFTALSPDVPTDNQQNNLPGSTSTQPPQSGAASENHDDLQSQISQLTNQNKSLSSRIDDLNKENEHLKQHLRDKEKEVARLQNEINTIERRLSKQKTRRPEVVEHQGAVRDHVKPVKALRPRPEIALAENKADKEREERVAEIKSRISVLESQIAKAESNMKKLKIQQQDVRNTKRRFFKYWKEKNKKLAVQKQREQLAVLQAAADAGRIRREAGHTFFSDGDSWYDSTSAALDIKLAKDIVQDAASQYAAWEAAVGKDIASAKMQLSVYEDAEKRLLEAITPLNARLKDANSEVRRLKRELRELQ